MQAAPVQYVEIIPGQRHFACNRLHAIISSASCADRFTRASTAEDWREGKYACCGRCAIGQFHEAEIARAAGQDIAPVPLPDLGAAYCVRCGRSGLRLIAQTHICVSCSNRAAEAKRGFNARGNPLRDYIEPRPRLVGVLDNAGRPTWKTFDGQKLTESLARAVRGGHKIHAYRPGRTRWNAEAKRFEYVDEHGHTLLEIDVDGVVEYIGVPNLHQGEEPAPVIWGGMGMMPEEAQTWLDLSGEADDYGPEWRFTEFHCSLCNHGNIQARRRVGSTETRCTRCGSNE